MITAKPSPSRTINGSAKEVVVKISTSSANSTPNTAIFGICDTVLVVAVAVDTALPVIAPSSSMISRILSKASMRLFSDTVTENNAFPSL